jgi:hypothetical protein
MTRYPVVNMMGQSSPADRISVGDFDALQKAALASINDVAQIARSHGLSAEEESAIRLATRKIDGFTVAMTPCPSEKPLVSSGPPWWAAGLAGLAIGGAVIHFAT